MVSESDNGKVSSFRGIGLMVRSRSDSRREDSFLTTFYFSCNFLPIETSRATISMLLGRSPLLARLLYLGSTFLVLSPLILLLLDFKEGIAFVLCISCAY